MGAVGAAIAAVCCLHLVMFRRRIPRIRVWLRSAGLIWLSRRRTEWYLNLGYVLYGAMALCGVGLIVYSV